MSSLVIDRFQSVKDSEIYFYAWDLDRCPDIVDALNVARTEWTGSGDRLTDLQLHVTARLSRGRDWDYEKVWYGTTTLRTTSLLIGQDFCALSVQLSPAQQHLYSILGSAPHVSLCKASNKKWEDIGPWVQLCLETTDWEVTGEFSKYSPSLRVTAHQFSKSLTAVCSIHELLRDAQNCFHVSDSKLSAIPSQLWATSPYDVGLMIGATPLRVTPKSDYRPCKRQYPLHPAAEEGIGPVFNALLEAGVVVPCPNSPCNSPILPVKKPDGSWRFVQDLRAINSAVQLRAPVVPNPTTILAQVPGNSEYFTVIDLANAFFSIPVEAESQYWFAFTFKGKRYTWSRLPQGYAESPAIFSASLQENLEQFQFSLGDSTIVQYVDDILICSTDQDSCTRDSLELLTFLASQGHKVKREKLQFALPEVRYLGHNISKTGKSLGGDRIQAILDLPKPLTKQQVMSFLGMTGYCRSWIPDYAEVSQPLQDLAHGHKLSAADKVVWTDSAEIAFENLKLQLTSAPTLGLPDMNKPFLLAVDEKGGYMSAVLMQKHGDHNRPVAYYSQRLDAVARGLPPCLRSVSAAASAITASAAIVAYRPLNSSCSPCSC